MKPLGLLNVLNLKYWEIVSWYNMNNKEIFFHLFNFLVRTKHNHAEIKLINFIINIKLDNAASSAEIKYFEKEDKIISYLKNFFGSNQKKIFDLDTYNYLWYFIDTSQYKIENFRKIFNLLVNCKLI